MSAVDNRGAMSFLQVSGLVQPAVRPPGWAAGGQSLRAAVALQSRRDVPEANAPTGSNITTLNAAVTSVAMTVFDRFMAIPP